MQLQAAPRKARVGAATLALTPVEERPPGGRLYGCWILGLKTTRNAVYQTAYHAVWIPNLSFSAPPAVAPSLAIQGFKGISARSLFAEFPPLDRVLRRGHLWAPSFYVGRAGQVSAQTTRRDIERAEHVRTRR